MPIRLQKPHSQEWLCYQTLPRPDVFRSRLDIRYVVLYSFPDLVEATWIDWNAEQKTESASKEARPPCGWKIETARAGSKLEGRALSFHERESSWRLTGASEGNPSGPGPGLSGCHVRAHARDSVPAADFDDSFGAVHR